MQNQTLREEFDRTPKSCHNGSMNSDKKQLMFAPGWFQEISTTSEEDEKRDLICYLSDTHKSIYGTRARWFTMEDSVEYLRQAADNMQQEMLDEIKWEKQLAHERMLEANKHALAVRRAKRPLPRVHKPFANLQEIV